jgi:hypothetical protein
MTVMYVIKEILMVSERERILQLEHTWKASLKRSHLG